MGNQYLTDSLLFPFVERFMEDLEPSAASTAMFRTVASNHGIPAVRSSVARLLSSLTALSRPRSILEIGTGAGFSTHALMEGADRKTLERFVTLEFNHKRLEVARQMAERLGWANRVQMLHTNALEFMACNRDDFDFIFVDAIKRHYPIYMEYIRRLKWKVAVFDNVLYRGLVSMPRAEVPPALRSSLQGMENFLRQMLEDPTVQATLIPAGDGILLMQNRHGQLRPENT